MSQQYALYTPIDIQAILVVDDKQGGRDFFKDVISELGKKPVVSQSAQMALDEVPQVQMIITAWEMRGMSGAAFIQRVLKTEQRKIPFLIYSQKLSEPEIALIKDTGIKNLVKMPLNKGEVLEIIEGIFEHDAVINPVEEQIQKAKTMAHKKDFKQAIEALTPYKEDRLLGAEVKTLMAEIRCARKQKGPAQVLLEEVLTYDPNYAPAIRLRARLYSDNGQSAEAIKLLEKLHEKSPLNIDNIVALGDTYLDAGQCDKARETYKEAVNLDSSNVQLSLNVAKATAQGGDVNGAVSFLADLGLSENYARDLNNVAISLSNSGQVARAITMYQTALAMIKKPAQRAKIITNIGIAQSRLGQHTEAFTTLGQLYIENPSLEKAYNLLCRSYQALKAQQSESALAQELVQQVKATRAKYTKRG